MKIWSGGWGGLGKVCPDRIFKQGQGRWSDNIYGPFTTFPVKAETGKTGNIGL